MLTGVGAAGLFSAAVAAMSETVGLPLMPFVWTAILAAVSSVMLTIGHAAMRPRFQFRMRTMMIVVTLLAVPCGYVGSQAKIVRERESVLADIENTGGGFFSDVRTTAGFWNRFQVWPDDAIASIDNHAQIHPSARTLIRSLLGDEGVLVIWLPDTTAHSEEMRIRKCIPEAYIWRFK
jgi:hypothetical protein